MSAPTTPGKIRKTEDDRGGFIVASVDLARLAPQRPGLAEVAAVLGLAQKYVLVTAVAQGAIESEIAALVGARAKLSDPRILNIHPRRVSLCHLVRGAIDLDEAGLRLSFLVHPGRKNCAHGTSPYIVTGAAGVLQAVERLPSMIGPPVRVKNVLAEVLVMPWADAAVTVCGLAAATLSSKGAMAAVLYEGLVLLKDRLAPATAVALAKEGTTMLGATLRAAAGGTLAPEILRRARALARIVTDTRAPGAA